MPGRDRGLTGRGGGENEDVEMVRAGGKVKIGVGYGEISISGVTEPLQLLGIDGPLI